MKNYNIIVTGANGETATVVINKLLAKDCMVFGLSSGDRHNSIVDSHYQHIQTDILDISVLKIAFDTILDKDIPIHGLINIAGGFTMGQYISNEISNEWERMYKVNFISTLNCISLVIQHMKNNNFGRIINFGSSAALDGMASAGPYIISKSSVHSLTKIVSKEIDDYHITCNAILPGIIATQANKNAMPGESTDSWISMDVIFNTIYQLLNSDDNGSLISI